MSSIEEAKRQAAVKDPNEGIAQVMMFILGAGTAWIAMSLAVAWWRPFGLNYQLTAAGLGAAMAVMAVPVFANFGLHEAAHHFVAEEHCGNRERHVFFITTPGILIANLSSVALVAALIGLDVAFGIDVGALIAGVFGGLGVGITQETARAISIMFVNVSPGGVFMAMRGAEKTCFDDTAIAGPATNLVTGIALYAMMGFSLPPVSAAMPFWDVTLALTFYTALLLSVLNALPLGSGTAATDGYKVLIHGDELTWSIQVACIVVPLLILGGVL